MSSAARLNLLYRLLTLVGLALLLAAYFSPVWWVSLRAPQYPPDAFPDGIRIHFHFNGVFNGCQKPTSTEIEEGEGLDCVDEMDTINHYVGMAPTSAGGPIERGMSHYSFALLGWMLLVFLLPSGRRQTLVLAIGYAALLGWMVYEMYPGGHLDKIAHQFGVGMGQFFNDQARIVVEEANLKRNAGMVLAGYGVIMVGIVGLLWFAKRDLGWVLAAIPAAMPVIFVADYAGWLYWFGHNLHPWGAFTVKPFMPTVFGDGKVAQFTTHSYPHYGYFLLVAVALVLLLAILLRRKALRSA